MEQCSGSSELVHDNTKYILKSALGSVLWRILHTCLGLEQSLRQKNPKELNITKLWEIQMNLPSPEKPKSNLLWILDLEIKSELYFMAWSHF